MNTWTDEELIAAYREITGDDEDLGVYRSHVIEDATGCLKSETLVNAAREIGGWQVFDDEGNDIHPEMLALRLRRKFGVGCAEWGDELSRLWRAAVSADRYGDKPKIIAIAEAAEWTVADLKDLASKLEKVAP